MKEKERDFKGIWITKEIWLTDELDIIEKCLLAEISSLCVDELCYASNEYFANFFQCSERKISAGINKLIKMGIIEQVGFDGRKRYLQVRVEKYSMLGSKKCDHNNTTNNIYKENCIKETETPTSDTTLIAKKATHSSKKEVDNGNGQIVDYDKINEYFDKTYAIYPRKVSKEQARETYEHKFRGLAQEEARKLANYIYINLQKQVEIWKSENDNKGREQEYMPYMSTWLNDNVQDSPHYKKGKRR